MALGGGSATPKGQILFFFFFKYLNSFWPLGVADPPPKGQGVASATLDWRSGMAEATLVLYWGGRPTPIFLSFLYFYFDLNLFFKK
jgi:hypothetical protein